MSCEFTRELIAPGVGFSRIQDPKFKQNRITAALVLPMEKEHVTQRALLPALLRKGTKDCPDFTRLNQRLSELYGAVLDADVSRYGTYQILMLTLQAMDDRFALENEQITARCAQLLCDILFNPNITDGAFDPKDVAVEKSFLIDTIESEINEKRSYAISRCTQSMFEGTPFAVKKYGYVEDAEKITPESAAREYETVLDTAAVEIMFVGSGTGDGARTVFADAFNKMDRHPIKMERVPIAPQKNQDREFSEEMDVNQGKLVMGFRIPRVLTRPEKDATRLMCAIFGGTPFSKLFLNVREKLSLCYYCAARFEKASGTVLVDSGVEFKNRDAAQKEILAQLEAVRRGEISDEEMEQTLLSMVNALHTIDDSQGAMENWYLVQILAGVNPISAQQDIINLQQVTREEIVEAARSMSLDSVYFLTGRSDSEAAPQEQED